MRLTDQELQELCNDAHDDAAEEIRELRAQLAASEARAERLERALKYIIDDLEIRSQWKPGDQKGVVDIGHGAYMQGKAALAEGEAG